MPEFHRREERSTPCYRIFAALPHCSHLPSHTDNLLARELLEGEPVVPTSEVSSASSCGSNQEGVPAAAVYPSSPTATSSLLLSLSSVSSASAAVDRAVAAVVPLLSLWMYVTCMPVFGVQESKYLLPPRHSARDGFVLPLQWCLPQRCFQFVVSPRYRVCEIVSQAFAASKLALDQVWTCVSECV
jgi:hypothetical protein